MGDFADNEPVFYEADFFIQILREGDEKFAYEGYSYGGNKDEKTGAALPYFAREIADEIMGNLSILGWEIRFDADTDTYIYRSKSTGTVRSFTGEDIEINDWEGGAYNEHVYPIGHGVIGWMEVVKSWIYVSRAQCPYCGHEFGDVGHTCDECGREVDF